MSDKTDKYYLMNNGSCRKLLKNATENVDEHPYDPCKAVECILPGEHPHKVEYYFQFKNSWIKITDVNGNEIWKAKISKDIMRLKKKSK